MMSFAFYTKPNLRIPESHCSNKYVEIKFKTFTFWYTRIYDSTKRLENYYLCTSTNIKYECLCLLLKNEFYIQHDHSEWAHKKLAIPYQVHARLICIRTTNTESRSYKKTPQRLPKQTACLLARFICLSLLLINFLISYYPNPTA